MSDSLYGKVQTQLPDLLQSVIGEKRANAVVSWLDATHHVRGQGSEGTSGRITAERELVSRALEQWLKEASELEDGSSAGSSAVSDGSARPCRDCGGEIEDSWWDSRRCEPCWIERKRSTYEANQERRRERRRSEGEDAGRQAA